MSEEEEERSVLCYTIGVVRDCQGRASDRQGRARPDWRSRSISPNTGKNRRRKGKEITSNQSKQIAANCNKQSP